MDRSKQARDQPDNRILPSRAASSVENLYAWVRAAILNGKIPAGGLVNQAQLALQLGVSRTPLREALRMLQAEGLVVGEINQRMRVAAIAPSDIDSVYATRILLECFGIAATVLRLRPGELRSIEDSLAQMSANVWIGDRSAWEVHHTRFHSLLIKHAGAIAGPVLNELIANFQLRCERYRRLYVSQDPQNAARAMDDHARIVAAVAAGSVHDAVTLLAEHYSHTALTVLKDIAPDMEAVSVRNSLALCQAFGSGGNQDLLGLLAAMSSALPAPSLDSAIWPKPSA